MTTTVYGTKYDSALGIVEIAKRVRADIKAAIAAGELPAIETSVRISRYSGGRSLNVTITRVPEGFLIANPARVREDMLHPHGRGRGECRAPHPLQTTAAREVTAKIKALVDAYNFDGSDIQSDYFHVNFYSDVKFCWKLEDEHREQIKTRMQRKVSATAVCVEVQ